MRIAPYIKFAMLVVIVSLTVAVADPHHRSTVARVALFALVGAIAVALVQLVHERSPAAAASPFEPAAARPPTAGLPTDLERMALEMRSFQAALDHGEPVVPAPLRRTCRRIALARLAERHPGRAGHPGHPGHPGGADDGADDAALAAAVGPALAAALDGRATTLDPDTVVTELEQL